jgi:protein-L-isoaspartate(D-aspartate) O-methyltransferase
VKVSLSVKGDKLKQGTDEYEQSTLVLNFFDELRKPIGYQVIGPWRGTFDWQEVTKSLEVPPATREAIMHIGLNGGTGVFSVDNIHLVPSPRTP